MKEQRQRSVMNVEGRGKVVVPRDKRIPLSQNVIWIFGRCTQAQWPELLKKKLSKTHNLIKRNPDDETYDKWNISQTNLTPGFVVFLAPELGEGNNSSKKIRLRGMEGERGAYTPCSHAPPPVVNMTVFYKSAITICYRKWMVQTMLVYLFSSVYNIFCERESLRARTTDHWVMPWRCMRHLDGRELVEWLTKSHTT